LGGHARVDKGRNFGIVPGGFINGWLNISSRVGLLLGSKLRIF